MVLASRGLRDLDRGVEDLPPEQVIPVRRQAMGVTLRALAWSLGLTALAFLVP